MKKIIGILLVVIGLSYSVTSVSAVESTQNLVAPRGKTATSTADLLKQRTVVAKLSGKVTAIGASSLTVDKVTVNIVNSTLLLHRYGAKAKLAEFSVGDEILVYGKWTSDQRTTIEARLIRNMSIQKRRGTFLGKITSVSNTGFVLTPEKRAAQTVSVNLLTKYVDRGEKPITLSAIKVGDKVMVKGLWDTKLNTISEVAFVRDYSIPVKTSKTATTSASVK